MTQDERRELARVQREVMWNLQKDEVVTIVRQGDEPVPYKRQGNPAVNTPISVRKRLALRNKPLIQVPHGKRQSYTTILSRLRPTSNAQTHGECDFLKRLGRVQQCEYTMLRAWGTASCIDVRMSPLLKCDGVLMLFSAFSYPDCCWHISQVRARPRAPTLVSPITGLKPLQKAS